MKSFKVRIELAEIVYREIEEKVEALSIVDAYAQVSDYYKGMNHKILSSQEENKDSSNKK